MNKIISLITISIFFIWILPLGVFIKPENEKKACNGQRAICLCRHLIAEKTVEAKGKVSPKIRNINMERSSLSSNPYFLITSNFKEIHKNMFQYFNQTVLLYSFSIKKPIDHVPKT